MSTIQVDEEGLRARLRTMIEVSRWGKVWRVRMNYEVVFRSRSRSSTMHWAKHMRQCVMDAVKWSTIK